LERQSLIVNGATFGSITQVGATRTGKYTYVDRGTLPGGFLAASTFGFSYIPEGED
jgi:hypothetical protein